MPSPLAPLSALKVFLFVLVLPGLSLDIFKCGYSQGDEDGNVLPKLLTRGLLEHKWRVRGIQRGTCW